MKDMRKGDRHKAGYDSEFKKATYDQMNVRVRKDSGIMDALDLMSRMTGMPKTEYIKDAVCDRLKKDGYLAE